MILYCMILLFLFFRYFPHRFLKWFLQLFSFSSSSCLHRWLQLFSQLFPYHFLFIFLGLMFAVRRLRSTHDILTGRAFHEDSSELRSLAEVNMPESVLPYVLHLLSYHPDFPTSSKIENDSDKRKLKNIMRNLRMVIDTLIY